MYIMKCKMLQQILQMNKKNIENLNIIENTSNITNIVQNENH